MPIIKISTKGSTNTTTTPAAPPVKEVVSTVAPPVKEVVATAEPVANTFSIPKTLFSGFVDVLRAEQIKLAKNVAEEFNIDYDEIVDKCLPDVPKVDLVDTKPSPSKPKKAAKKTLVSFEDATCLDDLKSFKVPQLKEILEENDLPISGGKTVLMARVWGINHPEDAPVEPKKRRGRPPKTKTQVVDVETNNAGDTEECELDAEKMADLYVDTDNKRVEEAGDDVTLYKLFKDKYIFQEGVEEMEFKGQLVEDVAQWSEDIPDDLIKILGMEA